MGLTPNTVKTAGELQLSSRLSGSMDHLRGYESRVGGFLLNLLRTFATTRLGSSLDKERIFVSGKK